MFSAKIIKTLTWEQIDENKLLEKNFCSTFESFVFVQNAENSETAHQAANKKTRSHSNRKTLLIIHQSPINDPV